LAIRRNERKAVVGSAPLRNRTRTALGPVGDTLFGFDANAGTNAEATSAPVPIVGCTSPSCSPMVGMVAVPTISKRSGLFDPETSTSIGSPIRLCNADNVAPPSTT
jgi:hypothetical protein